MLLNLDHVSHEALYEQIVRQIRALVLSGHLPAGTALPSIRDLARTTKVSVITVQKAYDELTHGAIIVAHRGKGYFVASLPGAAKTAMAQTRQRGALQAPVNDALREGLDANDIRKALEAALNASDPKTSSRKVR